MTTLDIEQHNAQVREVWGAYHCRQPSRVPIIFGINPRYTMFDHPANPRRFTFEQFFNDPAGTDLSKIFATKLELVCKG